MNDDHYLLFNLILSEDRETVDNFIVANGVRQLEERTSRRVTFVTDFLVKRLQIMTVFGVE